jgi:predicted RNase H-like nuclease/Holliday junction resolvase RusA-like endonuclease
VRGTGNGEKSSLFVGIDLGWTSGATGLAAVDDAGRLTGSGRVLTDDEIAAWLAAQDGKVVVAAVDAPLVVPNETGQRVPERLIGRAFGSFGASAHTTNRKKFGGKDPRAMRLAQRFGWAVDPHASPGGETTVCIEVYPHPAMVGLFELGYRLDYKKGNDERRSPGFALLVQHLESIPELALADNGRWEQLKRTLAAPKPGDLDRAEDELDAILCAHLAWLWRHRRDSLHVYGGVRDGYIIAPPPPRHRAVLPTPAKPGGPAERRAVFERVVSGRPTGYSAGTNEDRWKAAVRQAFSGCALQAGQRVQVEIDFALAVDQRGRNEPDLDNLIKSTVDALEGVIGIRPGTGERIEADDVRIDRITATKRPARGTEDPGAWIAVSDLGEATGTPHVA